MEFERKVIIDYMNKENVELVFKTLNALQTRDLFKEFMDMNKMMQAESRKESLDFSKLMKPGKDMIDFIFNALKVSCKEIKIDLLTLDQCMKVFDENQDVILGSFDSKN